MAKPAKNFRGSLPGDRAENKDRISSLPGGRGGILEKQIPPKDLLSRRNWFPLITTWMINSLSRTIPFTKPIHRRIPLEFPLTTKLTVCRTSFRWGTLLIISAGISAFRRALLGSKLYGDYFQVATRPRISVPCSRTFGGIQTSDGVHKRYRPSWKAAENGRGSNGSILSSMPRWPIGTWLCFGVLKSAGYLDRSQKMGSGPSAGWPANLADQPDAPAGGASVRVAETGSQRPGAGEVL